MLIFVLQTIWLYIKELAGRDLDIFVVAKFLIYFSPKLIPLVLPLTILLASIMVFGSFAENYEFAAMKSTGISLQRAMAGLSVFIILLGITTFFFSNNVIPWAEYNSYNLRKNIAKLKPAMVIAEGQFSEVGNFNIKVDRMSGEKNQYLDGVVMHQKSASQVGNYTTIIAENGELISSEDSDVVKLVLFNGNYYDDTPPKDYKERAKRPFKKSDFDKYTINIDLSQVNNVDLEEKNISDKYNMLSLTDLSYTIDSIKVKRAEDYKDYTDNLYKRTNIETIKAPEVEKEMDSITNILEIFDTNKIINIVDLSLNTVKSTNQIIQTREKSFKNADAWLNKHILALHEKLALGFACVILFFVGAPLGALIRKGGIGLPMVVAILLFLTYHFIGIFAKNSAKDGSFNPILASWFSTLIMLPLSVYLTRRATADQGLFEFSNISEPIKKWLPFLKQEEPIDFGNVYPKLQRLDNKALLNFINHPETTDFNEEARPLAFKILDERGFSLEELNTEGIEITPSYYTSKKLVKDFVEYSRFALIFYTIGVILFILYFVFKNNKIPAGASASIQLSAVCGFLLIVYSVLAYLKMKAFYQLNSLQKRLPQILLLVLGLPLYAIIHVFFKGRIATDFNRISLNSLK